MEEELYRFLLVRPADAVDLQTKSSDVLDLSSTGPFATSLAAATAQSQRATLAKTFTESSQFVRSPRQLPFGAALVRIADHFRETPLADAVDFKNVRASVAAILSSEHIADAPSDPNDTAAWTALTASASWRQARRNLRDSIVAIRESGLRSRDLLALVDSLRAMTLVDALAASTANIRAGAMINATLYLPAIRAADAPPAVDAAPVPHDPSAGAQQATHVSKAVEELLRVPLTTLALKTQESADAPAFARAPSAPVTPATGVTARPQTTVQLSARSTTTAMLSSQSFARLSSDTRAAIASLQIDPLQEPIDSLVTLLRSQVRDSELTPYSGGTNFGGTVLPHPVSAGLAAAGAPTSFVSKVPTTSGHVSPAGIGDLLVVKQQLKRYEGGDIAHIENVLQGETKGREHKRRRVVETIAVRDTETEVSEERETQSTGRFELRDEVQKQVQEEFGASAGLKVSASYGPTVSVEANGQFSYKNAKSESQHHASQISKELVDKATTKYSEKVREQFTQRLVEEVEELNRHGIDATGAGHHIIGVYQWVNKVYEAQLFNYGKRTMYEFMVPEPAAFYIWSLQQATTQAGAIPVPPPFTISPAEITEANYRPLIVQFDAKDVPPPPEPFVTVSIHKSGGPNPDTGPFVGSEVAQLPAGYEYLTSSIASYRVGSDVDENEKPIGWLQVSVSGAYHSPGTLPIAYAANSLQGWSFYVHVLCRRTWSAYDGWRQKVWDALHQGHQQQVAAYEDKLQAAQASTDTSVKIRGRNPLSNRELERVELKKSCVSLLTGTAPLWLSAIYNSKSGPLPSVLSQEQGAYVRFIEEAFEWEQMTYLFYPYFWARAAKWLELLGVQDPDPLFQDFLTSGYARVLVPVRPNFEPAVEHFRQTGQVWSGGKLPDITDPDYLPLALELKEKQGAPGDEVPVGDPWDVVVPTQLVRLRPDGSLPQWKKQADGSWQET
jgi:hypothetical protein